MNKKIQLLVLTLILTACHFSSDKWELLDGSHFDTKQHNFQLILVNYWAIWCKPCVEEMEELHQFSVAYQHQAVVLGVNYDRVKQALLLAQSEKINIRIPLIKNDPASELQWPRLNVLPYTLVFDAKFNLIDTLIGPQNVENLSQLFQKHNLQ